VNIFLCDIVAIKYSLRLLCPKQEDRDYRSKIFKVYALTRQIPLCHLTLCRACTQKVVSIDSTRIYAITQLLNQMLFQLMLGVKKERERLAQSMMDSEAPQLFSVSRQYLNC
jgi:hypothetical protein